MRSGNVRTGGHDVCQGSLAGRHQGGGAGTQGGRLEKGVPRGRPIAGVPKVLERVPSTQRGQGEQAGGRRFLGVAHA